MEAAEDEPARQAILQETIPYTGEIEAQYYSHWRQLGEDDDLSALLGRLAQLRGEIDLQWVDSWAVGPTVQRLRRKFAHYFRIEDYSRWYFFHNSFRLFLTQRTAESRPGVFDALRDRALHQEVANKCRELAEDRW